MTRNEAIRYILNYAAEEIKLDGETSLFRRSSSSKSDRTLAHRSATKYACYKLVSLIKSNPDESVFYIIEHYANQTERAAEMIPLATGKIANYYMSTVASTAQDILDGLYIYDNTPLEGKIHGKG